MANDYLDVAALATINDQNAIDAGCRGNARTGRKQWH